jgi:hypothetical protein
MLRNVCLSLKDSLSSRAPALSYCRDGRACRQRTFGKLRSEMSDKIPAEVLIVSGTKG